MIVDALSNYAVNATVLASRRLQGKRRATRPARYRGRSADQRSTTMPPEARTTPEMSERENANLVGASAVDNLIGETPDEHSPGIKRCEARAGAWGLGDSVDSSESRVEELRTKPGALPFVPLNRCGEFFRRGLGSANRSDHRPRMSFSMRCLTASHGSNSTVPASIASIRRRTSCSQADSAFVSAGPSKLARTSTASSARSFGPRRKASASTALAALVMPGIVRSVGPPNNPMNPSVVPPAGYRARSAPHGPTE